MAGRKAKPDALKEAQGNPGRRPLKAKAVEAEGPDLPSVGGVPAELSKEARKIWGELVPLLDSVRFVKRTDRQMLARYCENLSQWWAATRRLRTGKYTYWTESAHGKMKRINPDFMVQDRFERRLIALEDRIGLSPQARQNLLVKLANNVPTGLFNNVDNDGAQAGDPEDPDAEGDGLGTPGAGSAVGLLSAGSKLH